MFSSLYVKAISCEKKENENERKISELAEHIDIKLWFVRYETKSRQHINPSLAHSVSALPFTQHSQKTESA